tara:strand:+ start:336 stop:602 length:267 start_codon:yes stop_codon:yes gene_type:complete
MKVTISERRVYHKIAEVEIEIPSNIELDDVSDYLMENEHLYVDRLDNKISVSESEYGFGMGIGAYWTDKDQEVETRFDIESEEYGGHL